MVYQWLIAAITLLLPAYAGVCIVAATKIFREKIIICCIGSSLGIALFGTLAYALAHAIPLTATVIWIILGCLVLLGSVFGLRGGWSYFAHASIGRMTLLIASVSLIICSLLGSKLLIEKPEGLYTGIINAYGDITWHTGLITELSATKTLPAQDPIFAGTPLTYPFLSDFISAIMLTLGSNLTASVDVPAALLMSIIFVLVYTVGKLYGSSRTAGIIALLLFMFGGATLGWTRIAADYSASKTTPIQFLLHLPERDYVGNGGDPNGFHFLNIITSTLLPQRSMLFGLPIVLSIILLIHPTILQRKYTAILAGILAGMLPLFHAHACIALASVIIALAIISHNKRAWLSFALPAVIIGIPELLFYAHAGTSSSSFFRYEPGWTKGTMNVVAFWFQNTGFLIPISSIIFFTNAPKPTKALAGAGIFLFILSNTFLFGPWAWDNFKILIFWFICILPFIGWMITKLWNTTYNVYIRPIIILFLLFQTLSGALDIWKYSLPTSRTWQEWSHEAIIFASYVQAKVPISQPIVTASVHDSVAVLTGRPLFLGFPGHVWSHGVIPWDREAEIKKFYAGESTMIAGTIPKYIIIGPQEKYAFPNIKIRPNWKKIAIYGNYELFTTNP